MLSAEVAEDVIHGGDLSRSEVLMVLLAIDADQPKKPRRVCDLGLAVGLTAIEGWNVGRDLQAPGVLAIRKPDGWCLTRQGRAAVQELAGADIAPAIQAVGRRLREQVGAMNDADAVEFLREAIGCLEHGFLRAAVVFSWVGAVAILHEEVVANHLAEFNKEAPKVDPKWRPAKTKDDLGRMGESNFLEVLCRVSVIGKNVKQELKSQCLDLRNGCGHPSSLKVREQRVVSHLEILIDHVFARVQL